MFLLHMTITSSQTLSLAQLLLANLVDGVWGGWLKMDRFSILIETDLRLFIVGYTRNMPILTTNKALSDIEQPGPSLGQSLTSPSSWCHSQTPIPALFVGKTIRLDLA